MSTPSHNETTSTRGALKVLVHGHRWKIAMMAITSMLGGFAEAVFLVLVTRAAFAITNGQKSMGTLANQTVAVSTAMYVMVALIAFRIAMAVGSNWYASALGADVSTELRHRLASAFLRSTWSTQQVSPPGRLQELVTSFSNSGSVFVGAFTGGVTAGCSVVAMFVLAIGVDPVGSLVALAAVSVLGSFLRPLRHRVQRFARRATDDGMVVATTTNEVSGLGLAVQVFDVRGPVEQRVANVLDRYRHTSRRLALIRGLVPAIYSGLAYLALVGAVGVASLSETAKLTSLGAVMLVMLRSLGYGQQLQNSYSSIHSSLPAVRDVLAEINHYEQAAASVWGISFEQVCPLELQSVTFQYVEGQPVLRDVSVTVLGGEMVGVVGPSGSGKSTLVQLLLGLREPTQGRVCAAGIDIRELRHSDWARKVTFVPQAPVLINGTIADNVRFYREGISDALVEKAARMAGLHDEIIAFRDGYLHQVGDRGGNLSGGQQQRLCIARALVGKPEVLILDEPTSALDAQSEAIIRESLDGLRGAMTIIVIAHRLSTIEQCDRIMIIQDGAVAAFDTPQALRESANFYADAVRLSGLT